MSNIILRIEDKRYKGISSTGKSHTFLSSGNGGIWFNIPKSAITKWKNYERKIGTVTIPMIEVQFDDWCIKAGGNFGVSIDVALNRLSKDTYAQVIR